LPASIQSLVVTLSAGLQDSPTHYVVDHAGRRDRH
jgi:hypothetical protein